MRADSCWWLLPVSILSRRRPRLALNEYSIEEHVQPSPHFRRPLTPWKNQHSLVLRRRAGLICSSPGTTKLCLVIASSPIMEFLPNAGLDTSLSTSEKLSISRDFCDKLLSYLTKSAGSFIHRRHRSLHAARWFRKGSANLRQQVCELWIWLGGPKIKALFERGELTCTTARYGIA